MKLMFALSMIIFLASTWIVSIEGKTLFEDDFNGGDAALKNNWVLLPGAGKIELGKDNPPKYGPNVLIMNSPAGNTLAFVKQIGTDFKDGILEILWRDANLPEDADGPLIARSQGLDEVTGFFNCYLVELDTDTGLHIATIKNNAEDIPEAAKVPASRSTGEWTWMKFQLAGKQLKVKTWSAKEKEPEKWSLEFSSEVWKEGGVGLRTWSGVGHIAFFRVSDLEGPFAVERLGKLSTIWGKLKSLE